MKHLKSILIILLVTVTGLKGYSQSKPPDQVYNAVWIYDCKTDQFTEGPNKYLKEGSTLAVRYVNVNPFALTSNPSITTSNEMSTSGSEAIGKILASITTVGQNANDAKTKANNTATKAGDTTLALRGATGSQKRTYAAQQNSLKQKADTIGDLIIKKKQAVQAIRDQIDIILAQQPLINNVILFDTIVTKSMADPNIHGPSEFTARVTQTTSFDTTRPEAIIESAKLCINNINNAVTHIRSQLSMLQDLNAIIKQHDKTGEYSFPSELDSLTIEVNNLSKAYNPNAQISFLLEATGAVNNYEKLRNCDFTLPDKKIKQINDDEVSISDTLKKLDGAIVVGWGPFNVYSYGGKRVNVSVGFAACFGNLNATTYSIIRDSSGKAISLNNGRQNSIGNFSPILFVNYVFKMKNGISPAISVGLNPDFSNLSNSRLLVGGSISLSESNSLLKRFLFSGGLGMGMTQCLNPKYYTVKDYLTLTSLTDSELTQNAFRFGGFFAVSFNLSN